MIVKPIVPSLLIWLAQVYLSLFLFCACFVWLFEVLVSLIDVMVRYSYHLSFKGLQQIKHKSLSWQMHSVGENNWIVIFGNNKGSSFFILRFVVNLTTKKFYEMKQVYANPILMKKMLQKQDLLKALGI